MKRILLPAAALLFSLLSAAAEDFPAVKSKITEVTVYLRGAQVTRQASVNLPAGNTVLAFDDLPAGIDPQSIQARGEGNFVILSLIHQVNYMGSSRSNAAVAALQDSLKLLEGLQDELKARVAVADGEEKMLMANMDLGRGDRTPTVAELKLAADFYRSRLSEVKKEQVKLAANLKENSRHIEQVRNQLNSMNAGRHLPVSGIRIRVTAAEAVTARLWISYTVNEAGWTPSYDVRAKSISDPVQLWYNARVFQNTGEDWNRVALKLSTANPAQRGDKPDLQPWYLDFEQPPVAMMQYNALPRMSGKTAAEAPAMVEEVVTLADAAAPTAAAYTEVGENQTNIEFAIKVPCDIPSDNQQVAINVQESTLPATYMYYCAPKLDREAFLLARITGWESLNLLPGELNLFFEGTFVGRSALNVRNTSDTIDLSLGRDRGIVVTRVKMKDYTERKTIGSNVRETRTWELTVRNAKKQAVNLRLEDQLPVPVNKDISLETVETAGGSYDRETGKVTWQLNLAPSEEKKFRVSFAVKYPKEKKIFLE
jgi:uncharacterized protein (TIGR02231 family)